jgi:acyl-CoA thioesterase YciA
MPRDANPAGDIFGGWTLSQMDLAGATLAAERAGGRVATVSVEAMKFLHPIAVGDEVSCFCTCEEESAASVTVRIETWTRTRGGRDAEKVTEGLFTYVAVTDEGKLRRLDG